MLRAEFGCLPLPVDHDVLLPIVCLAHHMPYGPYYYRTDPTRIVESIEYMRASGCLVARDLVLEALRGWIKETDQEEMLDLFIAGAIFQDVRACRDAVIQLDGQLCATIAKAEMPHADLHRYTLTTDDGGMGVEYKAHLLDPITWNQNLSEAVPAVYRDAIGHALMVNHVVDAERVDPYRIASSFVDDVVMHGHV